MAKIDREPCGERGTAEERETRKGGNEDERKTKRRRRDGWRETEEEWRGWRSEERERAQRGRWRGGGVSRRMA